MARPSALPLPLLLLLALLAAATVASAGEMGSLGWELRAAAAAAEDDEFGLSAGAGGGADSVVRRVLQSNNNNGYISYGALRRDNVPCSVRGASYYNCRPGAQANPYSRGCSAITRCRG